MRRLLSGIVVGVIAVGMSLMFATGAQASELEFPGEVRLCLPEVIYAVPDVEVNVYFDNVILAINAKNYAFDVTCPKGTQQAERWTYVAATNDVGVYPFTLEVRNNANQIVARAESTVQVAPADAGADAPVTVLCVGDSLTHASVYTGHLLDLSKMPGNPTLRLVGTHGPGDPLGDNRHEGYGGWTAYRFVNLYTGVARTGDYRKRGSPFLYKDDASDTPKLDYARYCGEVNSGEAPDFVTILLGVNDTCHATDETIEEAIDTMFENLDTLIRMIQGVRSDTQIGVLLPAPPAATQDAFGANYKCGLNRWQCRRDLHRVVERLMIHYGNREKENIWLVPSSANLDCVHGYPQTTAPWNARTSEEGVRLSNGFHPAASGYKQIGDAIYCWMKSRLATDPPVKQDSPTSQHGQKQ